VRVIVVGAGLGDAIHAAPGFGGNLAMQDARRRALAGAARGEQDLLDAIGAIQDVMRRAGVPTLDADGRGVPVGTAGSRA
jgi:5-methylphenazine-1-carboxylate 1-monooxygenase